MTYKASCYCGLIECEASSAPFFTQYCHCNKCRKIASESQDSCDKAGYSWTAAFLSKDFNILKGNKALEKRAVKSSYLFICLNCKQLIYGISKDPNQQEGIGVNANIFRFRDNHLPSSFKPTRHVYYADRLIDIDDDLPKFTDFPIELGGSGNKV